MVWVTKVHRMVGVSVGKSQACFHCWRSTPGSFEEPFAKFGPLDSSEVLWRC